MMALTLMEELKQLQEINMQLKDRTLELIEKEEKMLMESIQLIWKNCLMALKDNTRSTKAKVELQAHHQLLEVQE